MANSYPNLPGIEVTVNDGGLILPEDGTTESVLIIAPCIKQDAPTEPVVVRQSSDAISYFGDYTDNNGTVVNPIVAGWKAAFEGGSRRNSLLALNGTGANADDKLKDAFLKAHDLFFGILADFTVDNVVIKDYYADKETVPLVSSDFTNADDVAAFPNVAGILKYGYKVNSSSALAYPITVSGASATQVETATIGTTNISTAGNFDVIVTGAGITGSPLTISVPVALADTASLVGGKVRSALTATTAISSLYTISGSGTNIVLTKKVTTTDDATLNVELFAVSSTAVGSVNVASSADTTVGVAPTANFIINNGADLTVFVPTKTYDGTSGKTFDDLATDLQVVVRAADASLINFVVVAENNIITILGDTTYTVAPGATNDLGVALKLVASSSITTAVKQRHDSGMIYVGSFAELLKDYCEDQTINHNTVKGYIGVSAPASNSLSDVKTQVDTLVAMNNSYSGHVSVIAGPELGYNIPGKSSIYYTNGLVTYVALVSTLKPESAPTNKAVSGVVGMNYSLSLRQLNALSGAKYVSFRVKNGAVYVTDGITTAPDIVVGGLTNPSDYTRLSTLRITHAAINLVREVADPFVGEPSGIPQRNALNAAIKAGLDGMKRAGAIADYRFSVIQDRGAGVIGQSKVTLQLVPALENRKITVDVSLRPQLT